MRQNCEIKQPTKLELAGNAFIVVEALARWIAIELWWDEATAFRTSTHDHELNQTKYKRQYLSADEFQDYQNVYVFHVYV